MGREGGGGVRGGGGRRGGGGGVSCAVAYAKLGFNGLKMIRNDTVSLPNKQGMFFKLRFNHVPTLVCSFK